MFNADSMFDQPDQPEMVQSNNRAVTDAVFDRALRHGRVHSVGRPVQPGRQVTTATLERAIR
jgi:hypothetical protein